MNDFLRESLGWLVAGTGLMAVAVLQWRGRFGTSLHPYDRMARFYRWSGSYGFAAVLVGLGPHLGDGADGVVSALVFLIPLVGLATWVLELSRPTPAWQRRQIAWLEAEAARYDIPAPTPWEHAPEAIRFPYRTRSTGS